MDLGEGLAIGLQRLNDKKEREKERARAEGKEAATLRKLMSLYDEEGKDKYTTMGLSELRGSAQYLAMQKTLSDVRAMKREEHNAKSLERLVKEFDDGGAAGKPTLTDQAPMSTGIGLLPTQQRSNARPELNARNLVQMLPKHAGAAGSHNMANLLRLLQSGDEAGGGSEPEMMRLGDSDVIHNRKTGAFQISPFSKANAAAQANKGRLKAEARPVFDKYGEPTGAYQTVISGDDPDAVDEWVRKANGKNTPAATGKTSAPGKKGDRVKQNGVVYEFDGRQWNAVQ